MPSQHREPTIAAHTLPARPSLHLMHHSSSLHTWALAALCSLVCLTRARGQAGLECAASGSCSVGHSRPWSGDVSASK